MVHFDGIDDYLTAGATTDWTFLKDGSDWTIFVVYRTVAGELGGTHVLLDSDGDDSSTEALRFPMKSPMAIAATRYGCQ